MRDLFERENPVSEPGGSDAPARKGPRHEVRQGEAEPPVSVPDLQSVAPLEQPGTTPAPGLDALEVAERLYPLPRSCWKPAAEAHAEVQAMADLIRRHWSRLVVPCPQCGTEVQRVQDGKRRAIIEASSADPWHRRLRPEHRYHRCRPPR